MLNLSKLINTSSRVLLLMITLLLAFSFVACSDEETTDDHADSDVTIPDTGKILDAQGDDPTDVTSDVGDEDTSASADAHNMPDGDDFKPPSATNGTLCEVILECQEGCAASDETCRDDCVEAGSDLAEVQYRDLLTCRARYCPELSGNELDQCTQEKCHGFIEICAPSPAFCLQVCRGPDDDSCAGETTCVELGSIVCLLEGNQLPEDAQDCRLSGLCDEPGEECYFYTPPAD